MKSFRDFKTKSLECINQQQEEKKSEQKKEQILCCRKRNSYMDFDVLQDNPVDNVWTKAVSIWTWDIPGPIWGQVERMSVHRSQKAVFE